MNRKNLVYTTVALLLVIASTAPAAGEWRNYKATFNLLHALTSGTLIGAEPLMTIQNPHDNDYSMSVEEVILIWSALEDATSPTPGVIRHPEPQSCTVVEPLNPEWLSPGEGLTIHALKAIEDCPSCLGTSCGVGRPCPSSCSCIQDPFDPTRGSCIPLTLPDGTPGRVTFEVVVNDGSVDLDGDGKPDIVNPHPAAVRTLEFLIEEPGSLDRAFAVEGSEVDMEDVQQPQP